MYHQTMESEVVLDHPNLKILYFEKGSYLLQTWKGSTPEPVFKELVNKIRSIVFEKNIKGIILDAREHKGLNPDMQQYAAKEIGESARVLGGLKNAIIVPENVFSKYSVENYSYKVSKTTSPVTIKFFAELYKAKQWLEEND